MPHSSVELTLEILQSKTHNAPFLALGQTVFWDEPMKATWRRLLDMYWPAAQLLAGIHDTDYFAKTTAHVPDDNEFVALSHDDGATRGLWSAAGELSALLGSEDLPTRAFFESHGIPFDKLAGENSAKRREFFAEHTSAYGWRGVVQTVGTSQIARDVPLRTFGPALLDLLDWGFHLSTSTLAADSIDNGKLVAQTIRGWVTTFLTDCSDECTLTDLYQFLLPKFYELLLDFEPTNFGVTATTDLLRFNSATSHLPRFSFVNLFLNPATKQAAAKAYSKAVAGGGMYALEHFGPDALPFDVVVPGVGRGTLHVGTSQITVDFAPTPKVIAIADGITSTAALAEALNKEFGDQIVLVGKAVSLISMLSAEFILIFHETASGYTDRTAAMNNELRSLGCELRLNPIVRLQYQAWDSLVSVTNADFLLPEHLDRAFESNNAPIKASEFSKRWRDVISQQQKSISELGDRRSPRDLLAYLAETSNKELWSERIANLEMHRATVKNNYDNASAHRTVVKSIKESIKAVQSKRNSLEKLSGEDYHSRLRSEQDLAAAGDELAKIRVLEIVKEREETFGADIRAAAEEQRRLKRQLRQAIATKRMSERTEHVIAAKSAMGEIEQFANSAKLQLVRDAYLTVHGLTHTNSRPTAWWLPVVDPTGVWFDNITDTVEARLEEV